MLFLVMTTAFLAIASFRVVKWDVVNTGCGIVSHFSLVLYLLYYTQKVV